MKPEINIDNKDKFFSLYWRQEVLVDNIGNKIFVASAFAMGWCGIEKSYLLLKSLSRISDEDLNILNLTKGDYSNYDCFLGYEVDYLRSKGYAVEWMGLTVQEMTDAGWIKSEIVNHKSEINHV